MERQKKYAFLDTDFIFKSHLSHDALQNTLADMIVGFEDFEFFCHEMILNELSRHHITPDLLPWLNNCVAVNNKEESRVFYKLLCLFRCTR